MHEIANFAPLLSHARFSEKMVVAQRIIDDAAARRRAVEEASNGRTGGRANRRAYLLEVLDKSWKSPARNVNHAEFEAELARLNDSDKTFRNELCEARVSADEECQTAQAVAVAALGWLGEQLADWRAAGEPEGPWLRHVAVALKGKKPSVELLRELRAEVEEIEHQVLDVRLRPATAAELKANLDAALADVAKLGRLNLQPRQRRSDPFGLLEKIAQPHLILPARGSVSGASAMLIALFERDLREHLHEQIDAADLTSALSVEQQEIELTRLADKRLQIERQEEGVIVGLEEQGVIVARRPNLDPRAFLEVEER